MRRVRVGTRLTGWMDGTNSDDTVSTDDSLKSMC